MNNNPTGAVDPLGLCPPEGSNKYCTTAYSGTPVSMGGWHLGVLECGVDPFCIDQGGIDPFGSPVAQIHCDDNGCMTGSWAFSQYNVGGSYSVDWSAQAASEISYHFAGGDGSVLEQQKELAAIQLGKHACTGQDSASVAACIQDAYDTLYLKTPQNSNTPLVGGNYNFDMGQVVIAGSDIAAISTGCFGGRCGIFDSLHFHGDGTFHVDTGNPYFAPVGSIVHLVFDVIGGNSWWKSGIPRPWWRN